MSRPVALLLGPLRDLLHTTRLAEDFMLTHFRAGQLGPMRLAAQILRRGASIVHLSTTGHVRDLFLVVAARLCGARVLYQGHGGHDSFASKAADAVVQLPSGIDCTPYLKHNRLPSDPGAALKLVYFGRLARESGVYEVIEALRLARFRGVSTRLVIAGSGAEEARLRQRIRDLALSRDVAFTTFKRNEKARLLAQADVVLVPSYGEEGPYGVLEAMAAGAVPIATQVGTIAQLISDAVHGCLVPPRDPESIARAIERLAHDRPGLARMSGACRKRIAGAYSIEHVAAELARIYAGLCMARVPKTAS